jgi:hypothetical protein
MNVCASAIISTPFSTKKVVSAVTGSNFAY